jgi:hypothetical protein
MGLHKYFRNMAYNSSSKKFTSAQQAILTTVLYSDIFSFPLTKEELWKFLIARKKISRAEFEKSLRSLSKIIVSQNNYYCLSGREDSIAKRIRNIPEVEKKMHRAGLIAEKLSQIPSIVFIGISGGLAVGNAQQDDDIDLVIITKKNTLFVSRLLVLSLLQQLGVRRTRKQKDTADMICVNLLFDETALSWFGNFQDIYTAREIAQMVPIFERDNTYQKFLLANSWIESFLPNIALSSLQKQGVSKKRESRFSKLFLNLFFESLTRFLQMSMMKRHRSIETVSKHVLAFHPYDYRIKTLEQLKLKMHQLGLLTKI